MLLLAVGCADQSTSTRAPPTESVTTTTSEAASERSDATALENRTVIAAMPPREFAKIVGLVTQGQFEQARQAAGKFLVEHKENGQALFLFGFAYHKEKRYAEAQPYFERALQLEPGYDPIHHFFAYCLYYLGDMEAARREFEAHLEASPDEADSHFGLGLVELETGRLDTAEACFRQSIELTEALRTTNPRQYRARHADLGKFRVRLADVHFARGEHEAARDELIAALEITPEFYAAHYTLSLVYRRLGEDGLAEEALRSFEAAREAIHPDRSKRP